ncbi:phage tail assembly protein [Pseudomonas sp. SA3-5]|uniref:Phage tail assembly protein n=1 Tax=Pseudomonas aestuarii TaxID=3018340 RepID=A0ABT4XE70_9PSED|nr:phage tail assembly protein [Pseudomonas aestuarii]MDA7086513.1 phage tail assembly protein [Pseudomonas aestuarii]
MPKSDTASAAPAITAQPEPVKNPNEEVCELDTPIVRGTTSIDTITVRKPMAGELRGVALVELMNLEVNALRKVLPRITSPALTDIEVGRMDPADLVDLGSKVASFLLKKSAKAEAFLTA